MTRIYFDDKKSLERLKLLPAVKVDKCPIPSISGVYEIHGRALARRRNPTTNFGGNPIQKWVDRVIDSGVIVGENGEPCLGKSCILYGSDGKEALWCKYEFWKNMTPEVKRELDEILERSKTF